MATDFDQPAGWFAKTLQDVLNPVGYGLDKTGIAKRGTFVHNLTGLAQGSPWANMADYWTGDREVHDLGDLSEAARRTFQTGLNDDMDEIAWKYVAPAIIGSKNPGYGALAGLFGGFLSEGGKGEDTGDWFKSMLEGVGAGAAGGLAGKLYSGGSAAGTGVSASASGGAGAGSSAAGSVAGSTSGVGAVASGGVGAGTGTSGAGTGTLHGGEVSGLAVQRGTNTPTGDGGGWYSNLWDDIKGEFGKNPEMFYELLGAMGDNLMGGRPMMQGVAQPMAQSAIANRAQQRQDMERRELLKAFAEYLSSQKKSGMGSLEEGYQMTPKGRRGVDSVKREIADDGTIYEVVTEVIYDPNEEVPF